jgi:hypothetical protein
LQHCVVSPSDASNLQLVWSRADYRYVVSDDRQRTVQDDYPGNSLREVNRVRADEVVGVNDRLSQRTRPAVMDTGNRISRRRNGWRYQGSREQ